MSSQLGRLVLVPAVLFVVYSGSAFLLAKVHPAKPEAPKAAATTTSSGNNTGAAAAANAENGKSVYADNCASCHGSAGEGGSGPKLAGTSISPEAARSQIDNGGGSMPAGLVSGTDEDDLLAYLETIFAQ